MPTSILVVEDNADNLTLIDYLLRAYGYEPLLARNGPDGIRVAIESVPDIILLDLRMPDMDGYEVATVIGKTPGLMHVRIVAMTASAMVGDRERIAAAGFDGYIQKPIEPETFLDTLRPFLSERPSAHKTAGGR
jgi:CheY-like chemotaxis protein